MNTRSLRIFLPVIIVLLTLASLREILHPAPGAAAAINLALNKSAKASSVASGGSTYAANRAVDGSTTTRWMSKAVDPSWIYVDLKQVRTFTRVRLNWGTAYGKAYQLQVSDNATVWTTIYTQANGAGGIDDIAGLTVAGRYVRMYGTQRSTTGSGYSLWEFEIYDETTPTATPVPPTATYTPTATPIPPTATNTPTATPIPHTATFTPTATPIPPTATYTPTATPIPPTATYTPTATSIPPTATYTPTATPIPPTATFAPTATSVPPTATFTPTTCTPVNLTKGPTLIYGGVNTEMRVVWQWTANSTFQLRWGTDATYNLGSANVTPVDTTNHMYGYTVAGLNPGSKYYYQVVVGTQCAGGTFYTAPAAAATDVKFVSYGDTRTNGSAHNGLAGQVIALFQADPAFQTLDLNVGDWVSGDTEAYWTGEWFNSSYGNIRIQDANLSELGVRGNHEGSAAYWQRYFPQPWQPGGLYWSFDYGPMHVTMLDQYTAYNAGSTQYNWLQNDLAASTKPWKFVVLHEPGWSAGGGHGNNTTVQTDLQPLFQQNGVSIVFGGHNHYYARAVTNGVTHLTMGGGGAPLHTPQSGYPNVVASNSSYSFGTFSITGNTLAAQVINNSGAVIDSFTITK